MKKKYLLLLPLIALTIKIDKSLAADAKEQTLLDNPRQQMHYVKPLTGGNNVLIGDKSTRTSNLIMSTIRKYNSITDPDKLDELSTQKFKEKDIEEATNLLITAAAFGHADSQSIIGEFSILAAQHLESSNPLSTQAIRAYTEVHQKVAEYLAFKLKAYDKDRKNNKIIQVSNTTMPLTFGSLQVGE